MIDPSSNLPVASAPTVRPLSRALMFAAVAGPLIFWGSLLRLMLISNGYFSPPGCLAFNPPDHLPIFGAVLALTAGLPYLHILWRLLDPDYKRPLALAVTVGTAGFMFFPAAIGLAGPDAHVKGKLIAAALVALSQLVLVGLAVKAYYSLDRGTGDFRTLLWSLIPPAIYFLLFVPAFFVANLELFPAHRPAGTDTSPVMNFFFAGMVEKSYADKHGGSYSPSLNALGPYFRVKTQGYAFTYTSGPAATDGRIRTYTLTARPTEPCPSQCSCSYFMDQTGTLHMTSENRPATPRDPIVNLAETRGAMPQM
jgi:hypothetical protein